MRREAGLRAGAVTAVLAAALLSGGPTPAAQGSPATHEETVDPRAIVESPDAMKVTTVIQCFCGTCSNQTLHDCTCGIAERERRRVAAALAEGKTPESLIAAYIDEHGPQIRIVPETQGLNLIGFSIPFLAAIGGFLGLVLVLRGWRRQTPAPPGGDTGGEGIDPAYRDRIARDLEALDR